MSTITHLTRIEVPGEMKNVPGASRHRDGDRAPDYAADLAHKLRRKIKGEVRFDQGSRALYATDASNYRQPPIGVVVPRDKEDIVETMALCRSYGAPVLARGGGTSLAGQCCNVAVVIDCSKYMRRVLEIDRRKKFAIVQPGCVLDDLRKRTTPHKLTLAPDPATHDHCTIGGMIGNNSCGVHALMGGKTDDNTEELEILTYDGTVMRVGETSDRDYEKILKQGGRQAEIYRALRELRDRNAESIRERFPNIPRRVSGYNLPYLLPEKKFHVARALVGSESTLVFVLEAKMRLTYWPPHQSLLVLGYPSIEEAADDVPEILKDGPIGLEGIDETLVENMKKKHLHTRYLHLLPQGQGWLLVQMGGESVKESDGRAAKLMARLKKRGSRAPNMHLYDHQESEREIWELRESGLGATAFVPGEPSAWPGWEDSAVPPDKMGSYLRQLCKLYQKYGYKGAMYGHFGQGCLHSRISFDLETAGGIRKFRDFMTEAAELVTSFGGSLSGEHGDGQARAEFLPIMFGQDMVQVFREYKQIWDPDGRMNPGKIVDPYRADENLRLGADYNPPVLKTHFHFGEEGGWSGAVNRCVGVGKCRREEGGVMCPSFMATLEEKDSTRGRSRMLFEMLEGEVFDSGWKSKEVFDALDLCLACKGCKSDCPVNVDMASYKAEFLSHYYQGKTRPRYAYSMGLIMYWARLASRAPELTNFFTQTPGISNLVKLAGGISQRRKMPPFAPQTFKQWFRRRSPRNENGSPVILWADTFNNHFHPRVAQAAVEVLEAAGYHVIVPMQDLCCGRPLYDYGMLDLAERFLLDTLHALREPIRAGIPVVGLEPSCLSVFRDEMSNLFPEDNDAKRLNKQMFTLGEFLARQTAKGYAPPPLHRQALVHGHCHHKSVLKMTGEEHIFQQMGLNFETIASSCCGMAGSFGFEPDKYDVSMKCGELALLPKVRGAAKDAILIADGFSCKMQIEEATRRRALHTSQVLQMALREGDAGPKGDYPERRYLVMEDQHGRPLESGARGGAAGVAIAAALAGGAIYWALRGSNR